MSSKKYIQEVDDVHSENEGNNIENIPWSQQVDEALTDLSSNYTEKVSEGSDVNASNLQCNNINSNVEYKGNSNSDVNCSKRMTWANIASQPLKHNYRKNACSFMSKKKGMPPPPMIPGKFIMDLRENVHSYNSPTTPNSNVPQNPYRGRKHHSNSISNSPADEEFYKEQEDTQREAPSDKDNLKPTTTNSKISPSSSGEQQPPKTNEFVEELKIKNNYNPTELDLDTAERARFFVIKSYSEDDIHRSIKYEIWCSTDHGNKRLDSAFRERKNYGGVIYLLFSVNGSGHFCGMAQMITSVDYNSTSNVWSQDKWRGKFKVKWIYVKDVPNGSLRHIRLENNENKSVTHSRDAQEVPNAKGVQVLKILHTYKHETSIFDDFNHYEKKQEAEVSKKDNCQNNQRAFNNIHNKPTQNNFNREYMHDGSNNRKKNSFKSQKSYGFKDFSSDRNIKQNDFKDFSDNTPQINKNNKICNEI